jgi:hypothetical protein
LKRKRRKKNKSNLPASPTRGPSAFGPRGPQRRLLSPSSLSQPPTGGAHLSGPSSTSSPRPPLLPRAAAPLPAPPSRLPGSPRPSASSTPSSMRRRTHPPPPRPLPLPETAAHRAPPPLMAPAATNRRPPPSRPSPFPLTTIKGAPRPPLHPAPLPFFPPSPQQHRPELTARPPERRLDLLRRCLSLPSKLPGAFPLSSSSFLCLPRLDWWPVGPVGRRR